MQTVDLPTLKVTDSDCWEFPDAKYLKVITSLSAGDIASLLLHFPFETRGPTKERRCSSLSGDILKNLEKTDIYLVSIVPVPTSIKLSDICCIQSKCKAKQYGSMLFFFSTLEQSDAVEFRAAKKSGK